VNGIAFGQGQLLMKYFRFLRPTRRRLRWLGICALLIPILWLFVSLVVVYVLTRRPHARFDEPAPTVAWGTLEEHQLHTSDGETLGAWLCHGPANGPSVVVLHGNRGCRGDGLTAAEFYAGEGCAVLLVSLRAHGDSTGEINDFGFSSRRDVVAAVEFLQKERPGLPIIVNGTSMGAAAAIFAAPELGERAAGYILESPYRDLQCAVRNRTAMYLPPVVDRIAYEGLVLVGPLILPEVDRIAPIDYIGTIPRSVPVLLLSGTRDERAYPSEAQELCDRIPGHGQLILFEGAGHGRLIQADQRRYREGVAPLLREVSEGRVGGRRTSGARQGSTQREEHVGSNQGGK
jgi:alpha-beta hydrolase superfamily lysophospholipase